MNMNCTHVVFFWSQDGVQLHLKIRSFFSVHEEKWLKEREREREREGGGGGGRGRLIDSLNPCESTEMVLN